jgi:phage shock protein C
MNTVRTKFYRDKHNGKWLGVCSGIADYIGLDVVWVRLGFVVLTLCGMGFMPVIYIALGMLAKAKPEGLYSDAEEEKFSRRHGHRAKCAPSSAKSTVVWPKSRHFMSLQIRVLRAKSNNCVEVLCNLSGGR